MLGDALHAPFALALAAAYEALLGTRHGSKRSLDNQYKTTKVRDEAIVVVEVAEVVVTVSVVYLFAAEDVTGRIRSWYPQREYFGR